MAVRAEIAGVFRKKNRVLRIRREQKIVTKKLFAMRKSCRSLVSAIGDVHGDVRLARSTVVRRSYRADRWQ